MDAYDQAVEYLTAHPQDIQQAWTMWTINPGGILFAICVHPKDNTEKVTWGCLTTCRYNQNWYPAGTDKLTQEIAADERIPKEGLRITVEHLPVFAEWQRRLDQELGRTPPTSIHYQGEPKHVA